MLERFAKVIEELICKDDKVILLYADISFKQLRELQDKYPKSIYNLGISEQSMVSFAAGMAHAGFKVYVYTLTPFLIERAFEQIKIDVNCTNLNVNLVGFTNYNGQGETHEETDCNKIMSLFSNIKSFYPDSADAVEHAVLQSYETTTPTFIKLYKVKDGT